MRYFLFFYTLLMLALSAVTLALTPRALKDVGQERQRLQEKVPGASFDAMVEAGYRMNTLLLLIELLYYYLLLRHAGPEWQFVWGGFIVGLIHIAFMVESRLERRRLKKGSASVRRARAMITGTAVITAGEAIYLVWVGYIFLQPAG